MKYQIKVFPIYEKGNYREMQEDAIFPPYEEATENDRLFMVCDGMGGHEAGEIASQAVCEAMGRVISEIAPSEDVLTEEGINQALTAAYDLLDERDPNPESEKKMGTTMTLLKLHREGATIAHIGDSRVYQFRPDENGELQVMHKTRDHSLVNDLLRVGELKPEEVGNFPRKNVITRAMQSRLERRPKADVTHIADVRAGDYFLLCSDGMLEHTSDKNLCNMIGFPDQSDEQKVEMLKKTSEENHDNHSAYLIHVLEVEDTSQIVPDVKEKPREGITALESGGVPKKEGWSFLRYLMAGLSLLVVVTGAWMYAVRNTDKGEAHEQQGKEKPEDAVSLSKMPMKPDATPSTPTANATTKPGETTTQESDPSETKPDSTQQDTTGISPAGSKPEGQDAQGSSSVAEPSSTEEPAPDAVSDIDNLKDKLLRNKDSNASAPTR